MMFDQPGREVFWNISFEWVFYALALLTVGVLGYAFCRRCRLWRLGKSENRLDHLGRRIRSFMRLVAIDLLLHRKIFGAAEEGGGLHLREFYPGIMHFLIFTGMAVLFLGTVLVAASHYIYNFLQGNLYLAFSLALDIAGMMVIIGLVLAIYRRYGQRTDRLDNRTEDLTALLILLLAVVGGFVVEGFRLAATELRTNPDWAPWSPGGYIIALAVSGLPQSALLFWHRVAWWLHIVLVLGAAVYIALFWNKLWHIVVSTLNIVFRNLEPRGAMVPIDLETADIFGAGSIGDFSWKHLMDLDACTRCGRCQDRCPAYLSDKPLSPKKVIQDMRSHWLEKDGGRSMGEVVGIDEIWNCTTCYACQEACPVYIEPMAKIIQMRQNLVMEQASIPETGEAALKSIEARGHPWRGTTLGRTDWAEGLNIKILADDGNVDVLFWVGCTEALEQRGTRVAQSIAGLMKLAGINFGILGAEESCCGDPARRLGNEYLFQLQAQRNIELFRNYGIKKVVTGCPHCYNTLKYEYPQFGADIQVVHHAELFADLLRKGLVTCKRNLKSIVTYHDSCYLGRYNGIYGLPREVLKAIPGLRLVEMRQNWERSFCCGAGGGHLWLEEQRVGKRINAMRVEQAALTQAGIIATACPYCLQMFEDALRGGDEETMKVMDIAELLSETSA
jgi:Fe-S oxidoreductase/nitrate reductase gamma subunit